MIDESAILKVFLCGIVCRVLYMLSIYILYARERLNCFNKCLFNCGVSGRSIEKLLWSIEKLLLARDVVNVFNCRVSGRSIEKLLIKSS